MAEHEILGSGEQPALEPKAPHIPRRQLTAQVSRNEVLFEQADAGYLEQYFEASSTAHTINRDNPDAFVSFRSVVASRDAQLSWRRQLGADYNPTAEQAPARAADDQPADLYSVQLRLTRENGDDVKSAGVFTKKTPVYDADTRCVVVTVETPNGPVMVDPATGEYISEPFEDIVKITEKFTVVQDGGQLYAYGSLGHPLANGEITRSRTVVPLQNGKLRSRSRDGKLELRYDTDLWDDGTVGTMTTIDFSFGFPSEFEGKQLAFYKVASKAATDSDQVSVQPETRWSGTASDLPDLFATDDQTSVHPHIQQATRVFDRAVSGIIEYAERNDRLLHEKIANPRTISYALPAVTGPDKITRQLSMTYTAAEHTVLAMDALDELGSFVPLKGFALVLDSDHLATPWIADPRLEISDLRDEAVKYQVESIDSYVTSYLEALGRGAARGAVSMALSLPEISQLARDRRAGNANRSRGPVKTDKFAAAVADHYRRGVRDTRGKFSGFEAAPSDIVITPASD